MKYAAWFSLALVTLLGLIHSPVQAGPKDNLEAGSHVAAQWSDGNYYVGTVSSVKNGKFAVLFEDGDRGVVDADHIFPLRKNADFNVGDHVLAAWKGSQLYPGEVTAVMAGACRIKWDDGDAPSPVAKDRMIHWGKKRSKE